MEPVSGADTPTTCRQMERVTSTTKIGRLKVLKDYVPALFLLFLMIWGPLFIVNVTFKDCWGRPRPDQIESFGGNEKYLLVWYKGVSGKGKSFPSGHASAGFYLFAPFFFLRKRFKKWALFFLFLGLGYGSLMGIGRVVSPELMRKENTAPVRIIQHN
jgi:membrane-associated PAP2 superfamily phosphatase